VRRELSKADVERLFVGATDGALAAEEHAELKQALASNEALESDFARYQRAVTLLKSAPKEKAPPALAAVVMRRVRRRRGLARRLQWEASHHLPAEVIVPVLLGVAMAALLVIWG
jgi:anti-sigma factor RsiW